MDKAFIQYPRLAFILGVIPQIVLIGFLSGPVGYKPFYGLAIGIYLQTVIAYVLGQ